MNAINDEHEVIIKKEKKSFCQRISDYFNTPVSSTSYTSTHATCPECQRYQTRLSHRQQIFLALVTYYKGNAISPTSNK